MGNDEHNEDIVLEPDAEEQDVASAKKKIAALREELERAKKERQEYLEGWQRCKADAINLRRELEQKAARSAELLREALVHDIIPALDSFDVAAASEAWASVSDGWKSGMEAVRDQLLNALRSHGIERFGRVGEQIDHTLHEVIEERDDVAGEVGTVARVVRYGYRAGERILRPAHVIAKK